MHAPEVLAAVRRMISQETGRPLDDVVDAASLGSNGLGLDSIGIAELLLHVEDRFGIEVAALLDGSEITVGRLLDRLGR